MKKGKRKSDRKAQRVNAHQEPTAHLMKARPKRVLKALKSFVPSLEALFADNGLSVKVSVPGLNKQWYICRQWRADRDGAVGYWELTEKAVATLVKAISEALGEKKDG